MGLKKSHNNKGGSIASNGYKLIYVGKEHHLSDVRGYAYEHRIVAEKKYGRRLLPKEQIHHIDHDKLNNSPQNLEVIKSMKYHRFLHRKINSNLKLPDEKNILIKCKCGCGKKLMKYDDTARPREYVSGHNPREDAIIEKSLLSIINEPISLNEIHIIINVVKKSSIKQCLTKLVYDKKISRVGHGIYAKKGTSKLKQNKLINCSCGCGKKFLKYDDSGRERKFISGHNMKIKNNGK